MIYTIQDALDDASSWDIGSEAFVIARIEHEITGEIRELTFKEDDDIESKLDELDSQGFAITAYTDEQMFSRECSISFDKLMTQMVDDTCS